MSSLLRVDKILPVDGAPTGGGGGIIQVVTTQSTTAAGVNVAQNTFTNLSAINCTITPKSASSKILISGLMTGEGNKHDVSWTYKIMKSVAGGSDADILIGDSGGNRIRCLCPFPAGHYNDDQDSSPVFASFSHLLDSPSYSVGQSIEYKFMIHCINSGAVWSINGTNGGSDTTDYERSASYMTLMEVSV